MRYKNSNSKKSLAFSRKKMLAVGVLLLCLIIGFALLYADRKSNDSAPNVATSPPINLEPATKEDKQRAAQNKEAILAREKQLQEQEPISGKKTVTPIITYAGQYGSQVEVGGYVSGIFEDGGTCKANFAQGSTTFSKIVNAVKGANSMDCPVMIAQNADFPSKGSWTVIVVYDSSSASGSSAPKQIEIK